MAFKFTAGPWEYDTLAAQVDTRKGSTVCEGIGWSPDGRLIAAAPDLYAACAQAEDLIRNGGLVPVRGRTWTALVAAMAKARGEPPSDQSESNQPDTVPASRTFEA